MSIETRPREQLVQAGGSPSLAASGGRKDFRADIQGLRALAVLVVVGFHAGIPGFAGGYVGVDVFFVISGFLITGALASQATSTSHLDLRDFYARRFRRIIPMASLVLITVTIVSLFAIPPISLPQTAAGIVAATLFVSNWFFAAQSNDYMASDVNSSPVLNYWSLSVEEQFYAIWPLTIVILLWCLRRWGTVSRQAVTVALTATISVLALVSLAWSIVGTEAGGTTAYFGLHTRFWELAAGAALALAATRFSRIGDAAQALLAWAGLAAVSFAVFTYSSSTVFPGSAALVPVAGTVALLAGGQSPLWWSPRRLFCNRVAGYIGDRSYNLYLWHWPALVFAGIIALGGRSPDPQAEGVAPPLATVIALGVVALLTLISFQFVEQPLRQQNWMIRRSSRCFTAAAAAIAVCVAAPAAVSSAATTALNRYGVTLDALNRVKQDYADVRNCELNYTDSEPIRDCFYGDLTAQRNVALIGDSHASMWLPALSAIASQRHWRLTLMTKAGCPVLAPVTLTTGTPARLRYPSCDPWRRNVFGLLREQGHFDAVFVGETKNYLERLPAGSGNAMLEGAAWANRWTQAVTSTVPDLSSVTSSVFIFVDPPRSPLDMPTCISSNAAQPHNCDFDRAPAMAGLSTIEAAERRAFATRGDLAVRWIHTAELVCPARLQRCSALNPDGQVWLRDTDHLPAAIVTKLTPELARLMRDTRQVR